MQEILSHSFPSKYEYNIIDGKLKLKTRTTYFNEGQIWKFKNTRLGYLSIAKNMSTSFLEFAHEQQILENYYEYAEQINQDKSVDTVLAFMRDPTYRYVSGLTEYICMKFGKSIADMKKQVLVDIIQTLISINDIDEHTIEQIHFFRDIDLSQVKVFMMDNKLSDHDLFKWLNQHGVQFKTDCEKLPRSNSSKGNDLKLKVRSVVFGVCFRHQNTIQHKCIGDYELIKYFKNNNQIVNI